jgi:hypothetical protein
VLRIYEQGANGRKRVSLTSLRLVDLQSGRFTIFHPLPHAEGITAESARIEFGDAADSLMGSDLPLSVGTLGPEARGPLLLRVQGSHAPTNVPADARCRIEVLVWDCKSKQRAATVLATPTQSSTMAAIFIERARSRDQEQLLRPRAPEGKGARRFAGQATAIAAKIMAFLTSRR